MQSIYGPVLYQVSTITNYAPLNFKMKYVPSDSCVRVQHRQTPFNKCVCIWLFFNYYWCHQLVSVSYQRSSNF